MKTKVSQKNKNIINIKINTEKKAKNNRRKRAKAPGSGKSSYNSGYSVTPPIIINHAAPPVFPQYNHLPEAINNITREPEKINNSPVMVKQEEPAPVKKEPVNMITERLVKFNYLVKPSSQKEFINNTSTSPIPLSQNTTNSIAIPSMNSINDNFNKPKPLMVNSETSMEKPEMKDAGTFVRRGKKNQLYDDTPVKGRPNKERQHRRMEAQGIVTPSRLRYREETDDDEDDGFEIKSPFHQI
jgi:hypothetical protein